MNRQGAKDAKESEKMDRRDAESVENGPQQIGRQDAKEQQK